LGIALCQGGDRAILTYMGSLAAVGPDDVTDELLSLARHLHHGSFFLHTGLIEAMPDVFRRARALGLTTSLDTNWDPDETWDSTLDEVLPLTNIFFPNEQELLRIARRDDVDHAVEWAREQGVPIVAVKRGEGGASAFEASEGVDCTVDPVTGGDSVGAGDSFDAGFLAAWLRDLPLSECLKIACLCGRSVAGSIGGLAGQPAWAQVVGGNRAVRVRSPGQSNR